MLQTINNCLTHSSGSNRNFTTVVVFTAEAPPFFFLDDTVHTKVCVRGFWTQASQMCVRCEGRYSLKNKSGTCYDLGHAFLTNVVVSLFFSTT